MKWERSQQASDPSVNVGLINWLTSISGQPIWKVLFDILTLDVIHLPASPLLTDLKLEKKPEDDLYVLDTTVDMYMTCVELF